MNPILTSKEDGFFALAELKGHVWAGGFGYDSSEEKIIREDGKVPDRGIHVGESVCRMKRFQKRLIANTENNGEIWRSSKNGERWKKEFTGKERVGCGLEVFNGLCYATNSHFQSPSGRIYRSPDGKDWEQVYKSGNRVEYLRELVAWDGKLLCFGVEDGRPFRLVSRDGLEWKKRWMKFRVIRGLVVEDDLWLAQAAAYSNVKEAGIWQWEPGKKPKRRYRTDSADYVSELCFHKDRIWATTTIKWKGPQGGAQLLRSNKKFRNFKVVETFSETEAWAMLSHKGRLLVGTKQQGGNGKVYV